jgi:hypothetical protein
VEVGLVLSRRARMKRVRSYNSNTINLGWFDIWIDAYLKAMASPNETLRDSVCTMITPIVIKVNKNSLPLILSTVIVYKWLIFMFSFWTLLQKKRANNFTQMEAWNKSWLYSR